MNSDLSSPLLGQARAFSQLELSLLGTESLQEPNITASSQIMKDGTCFITLACWMDQAGEDVKYSWDPQGQGAVVSHRGTTLSMSWRSGVSDRYRCTAKNPISQSSSSIPVRPLCSGNCFLLRTFHCRLGPDSQHPCLPSSGF